MNGREEAEAAEQRGDFGEAARLYLEAGAKTGEAWTAAKAGELYLGAGDKDNARKAYLRLFGCGNHILYDKLVDFYFRIEDYASASGAFACCYPDAPKSRRMALADRFLDAEAYGEAESWYRDCIGKFVGESNPYLSGIGGDDTDKLGHFARGRLEKADALFRESNYKAALVHYARLAKNHKDFDYARIKTAECCFMLGDYKTAKEIYRALEQETDNAYFAFMLGECCNSEEETPTSAENAVYWYEYSLEGGCSLAYYHLGLCYQFGRGTEADEKKAERMYEEGAKRRVDRSNCLCKLGNLYYARGDTEKANGFYVRAARTGNARALTNIVICALNGEIGYFRPERLRCFLAKAAALGNRRAYDLLDGLKKK